MPHRARPGAKPLTLAGGAEGGPFLVGLCHAGPDRFRSVNAAGAVEAAREHGEAPPEPRRES